MIKYLCFSLITLFQISVFAEPTQWTYDPGHSLVGFSVRHLGLSKVKGKFNDVTTDIKADATGKITQVKAVIKAQSIDTDIAKRDDHLRSPDFFDVAKFPEISLVTKSIQWNGSKFTAVVDLTMKGVTKPVTFKGEWLGSRKVNFGDGDQTRAAYSASADINRQDFGLKFNKLAEGVSVVGDNVTIELEIEMSRKGA